MLCKIVDEGSMASLLERRLCIGHPTLPGAFGALTETYGKQEPRREGG